MDDGFNPNASGPIFSMAIQPDGKIVVVGNFAEIGGKTRNFIARLNPDGTLDNNFNPNANNGVDSITIQPDGKILVGGDFTTIGGKIRNSIARLSADDAALQELTVSSDGTTIRWMRSQSSPEIYNVIIESSSDMTTWTYLGSGTRIPGDWELTGLSLPFDENHYVRARGRAYGGYYNSSTSIIESVRQFYNPSYVVYNRFMTTGDLDGNDNNEVMIDFGSPGIWVKYNNNTWSQLHWVSPEFMVTGDMDGNGKDEVIIDFGSAGIWVRYNNIWWSKLHD